MKDLYSWTWKAKSFILNSALYKKPQTPAGDLGSLIWIINTNVLPAVRDNADDKLPIDFQYAVLILCC